MDNKKLFDNEQMYCLVAPDGTPQLSICGSDFAECAAYAKMMHKHGMSESLSKLMFKGFKILPVMVTVIKIGDENAPFNADKN